MQTSEWLTLLHKMPYGYGKRTAILEVGTTANRDKYWKIQKKSNHMHIQCTVYNIAHYQYQTKWQKQGAAKVNTILYED